MRYDNWDAILFPRDSHIPIQEFRTACYVAHDEYGRQLPTLTCYIASLPPSTPFRISLHSWATKARPSALIESRRKSNQRVVYTLSVVVDGTRVFHDLYEVSGKWPQEIMSEKRSILPPSHQSSQQKPPLEFPPFRPNVLMQSCWDTRDNTGRIKVLLSEQCVRNTHNPVDMEFGATNDIVCFLFQHAPRDILEQAGIAWPIRNPLYLPSMGDSRQSISQATSSYTATYDPLANGKRSLSPTLKYFKSPFERPFDPEPTARPNTAPTPNVSQFPKPSSQDRGRGRQETWDDSFTNSFASPLDDISMADSWTAQRTSSQSHTDTSMPDILLTSPHSSKPRDGRQSQGRAPDRRRTRNWNDSTRSSVEEDRHVVVTFREDQLGRLVEAFSPQKPPRNAEYNHHRHDNILPTQNSSHSYTPKVANMGGSTSNTRPSAAAVARTASYPNYFSPMLPMRWDSPKMGPPKQDEKKGSQDTRDSPLVARPSAAQKSKEREHRNSNNENRVPTPFPFVTRHPTPHPFYQGHMGMPEHARYAVWQSDTDMRAPSSLFSSLSGLPQQPPSRKGTPVPAPSAHGSIRSRKEGLGVGSPAPTELGLRHDKSLLPPLDAAKQTADEDGVSQHATNDTSRDQPVLAEASAHLNEPQMFIPGHRSGMSSIERVEMKLFSALDEELSSFPAGADAGGLSGLDDFDSPVMKRKRNNLSADMGKHPKMMREEGSDGSSQTQNTILPKLRGD